ncbi:troponin T, skeletal muscle-like [Lytechinus variegatus]|uniref:troponin T, skeletal muscle-like n=1 Tax=Lytechinus variegatus TaxID=7654 RepID=UPI001BB29D3E|nr:troponin T, skeletal muscle-like [Lytechinus variegatus]
MREDIQRRRQEAEAKRKKAESENQSIYSIPKYNIAESIARAKQEKMQTSAEIMAEREKRIEENFPQIRISARDSEERLREIAEILHAKLVEVYGDIYDLEQRKERQEYDLNEMNARIKDLVKHKTVNVIPTVDQGRVSMLKEKGFSFDDKATKQKQNVDLKASLPSSGHIADRLQKLQDNLKKDAENADKTVKKEPIKLTYSSAEQLKEDLEESKREAEKYRIQREENRKQREAEIRKMEEQHEERIKKAEEERKKQMEERERLKKEKEEKERAKRNMMSPSGAPINISKVVSQTKAKNREETIADRVPTMTISSTTTEVELRNFANDLYNRLKTTLGDVFDLNEQKKKNEYYLNELNERVDVIKTPKSSPVVSTGIVSKFKDGGAWSPKKQNETGKPFKPKELGGIASEGGVRGRLAMFSGGGDTTDSPPKKSAPAKINIYK